MCKPILSGFLTGLCLLAFIPCMVSARELQNSPAVAFISGRIAGYPSDWFPPMYIYARNIQTKSTYAIYSSGSLDFNAALTYSITVTEPGIYTVFAWTDLEYSGVWVGGLYGEPDSTGSIVPIPIEISLGQTVQGIDLEGDMFNMDQGQVPLP